MITYKKERKLDFYPTDSRWVEVLLRHVKFEGKITEPCCGDGAISDRLIEEFGSDRIESLDIYDYGYPFKFHDALLPRPAMNIITNPPYIQADKMIPTWLENTSGTVAVLMRLGYLEGKDRWKRYAGMKPHVAILVTDRMKHIDSWGDKAGSQFNHIWLIWDMEKQPVDQTTLIWDSIE